MAETKHRVLISEELLQGHINRLAESLGYRYQGKRLIVVGILNSSHAFLSDLTEAIERWNAGRRAGQQVQMVIDHLALEKGEQRVRRDIGINIAGQEVLVVDALLETGRTVADVANFLSARGPSSIGAVTMLKKNGCQKVQLPVSFYFFAVSIPAVRVAGKGLDHKGLHRGLPCIVEVVPDEDDH